MTTFENGAVTSYTTYCPLEPETTVITVTSCEVEVCTEIVITCDETCVDVLTTSVNVPVATTITRSKGQKDTETDITVTTKVTKTVAEGVTSHENGNGDMTGKSSTVASASVTAEIASLSTYEGSAPSKVANTLLTVLLLGLLTL